MKKNIIKSIIFYVCCLNILHSQPVEEWANFIGPNVYSINNPLSINLSDIDVAGNSVFAGVNTTAGSYNVFTSQYDAGGNLLWMVNNNTGSWLPRGCCMKKAGKFVYLVYESNYSIMTKKYNGNNGILIWTAQHNYVGNAFPMAITTDKNENVYAACCELTPTGTMDYSIVKYDKYGNQMVIAQYNSGGYDEPVAIAVDKKENIYVTGTGSAQWDYRTVKFDRNGLIKWVASYNGAYNGTEIASGLALDESGVYVNGISMGQYSMQYATVKYSLDGSMLWERRYSHSSNWHNTFGLTLDPYGNVYVTGGDSKDMATIKYNTNGATQWVAMHQGDKGFSLTLDDQQNVYVTGNINLGGGITDGLTIKYDAYGNQVWDVYYERGTGGSERPLGIKTDPYCGVIIAGFAQDPAGVFENFILKYNECPRPLPVSGENNITEIPENFELHQNYPNPFNPVTKIKFGLPQGSERQVSLKVYDINGREVAELVDQQLMPGTHEAEFSGSSLASGTYFYRLRAGEFTDIKKMILIK